jgi:hypothetical protein
MTLEFADVLGDGEPSGEREFGDRGALGWRQPEPTP